MVEKISRDMFRESIFFFVGKKLLHESHITIGELYDAYQEPDGFLYIAYS